MKKALIYICLGLIAGNLITRYIAAGTTWYSHSTAEAHLAYTPDITAKLGLACELWTSPEDGRGFYLPPDKMTEAYFKSKTAWLLHGQGIEQVLPR